MTDIVPTISSAAGSLRRNGRRLHADHATGRLDALHLRRRQRAHAQAHPVLRDAGHARDLARRLEGRDEHGPMPLRPGPLRPGPLAALPHRRGPRPRRTTSPNGTHERCGSSSTCGSRRRRKFNVLPLDDRSCWTPQLRIRPPVPPERAYTYYPHDAEVPERSAVNIHGVSYKILAEVRSPTRARRA